MLLRAVGLTEVVTLGILLLAFDLYLDLKPTDLREEGWLGFMLIILARPFVERLVEKSPLRAGREPRRQQEP